MEKKKSLGLSWEVKANTFAFQISISDKPFTCCEVLSTINSLFDPLGFVALVIIQGMCLLPELTMKESDWDGPFPQEKCSVCEAWRNSLQELQILHIP